MRIQWRRILPLTLFGIVVALLVVYLWMSWIYVDTLTNPGCPSPAVRIANTPQPEEHFLTTTDGLSLRAWYYPSLNGAAVIALGGMGGSLGNRLPPVIFLLEQGYGVLQIDSRACATPPTRVTLGYFEAEDAISGHAFLARRSEVDPNRIGVIGFSMGGVAAIRAAAEQPGIAAVIAEGGYFNLGDDIVETGTPLPLWRKLFLYSVAAVFKIQTGIDPWDSSPIEDLPHISPRPVFLIYGEYEIEAGRGANQFTAARQPKKLWVVPGGDHGRNHLVAPSEYKQQVISFFDEYLLSAP